MSRSFAPLQILRRVGWPIAGVVCLLVLAARVPLGFDRIRLRVVTAPQLARDQSLTVPLPDLTPLAGAPAAIILRLKGAAEPTDLLLTLDRTPVTRVTVPPQKDIRVDASASFPAGGGHELTLTANRGEWQLTYLEIANVHGFSDGVFGFVVVPRDRPRGDSLPWWLLVPLGAGFLRRPPRPTWPRTRAGRALSVTASAAVLLLFAVTLLADTFTPFKVLLSPKTSLLCAAVLYADLLDRAWRLWWQTSLSRRLLPVLPHAAVAVVFLWNVEQAYRPGTGFTSLILFGEQFRDRALPVLQRVPHEVVPGAGYDGQFYAQLALDPLLRSEEIMTAVDGAGYRGRRILLPWAAFALGLGRPGLVLQVYALLNAISWLILAWLLLRWLPPGTLRSTLAWTACVLSPGLLASARTSVPDGPSVLLLAVGVYAFEQNRPWLAGIVLGLSGLGRETNLLGGSILLSPRSRKIGRLVQSIPEAILLAAPLALWAAYLWHLHLTPGEVGPRNIAMPLSGYAGTWNATIRAARVNGFDGDVSAKLLTLVALTTQAVALLRRREWLDPWWRLGVSYLGLMVVLGEAVWEGYPGATPRVVLPMTIAFNVLLPRIAGFSFWPLWVLGNANMLYRAMSPSALL